MDLPIYLDHHATTPVDPRVLEEMLPYFGTRFGNAASRTHAFGQDGERAVEEARNEVARLIGARTREVIFTSGATEANNMAILGLAAARRGAGHIVIAATEHKAVLDPCGALAADGFELTVLPVDREGLVAVAEVEAALREDTFLVSIMLANNEIGVVQPLAEIAALTRARGIKLHSDAAQAVGKIPVDVDALGLDLMSVSAHKLYGPKGIGALWLRGREPRVRLRPIIYGGGHERGLRSGTLNVPGIVGLAAALRLAVAEMETESQRLAELRDRLHRRILAGFPEAVLHGHPERRLPGNLNLGFPGVPGEYLVTELRDVAVSTGSACTSADPAASHVLAALGVGGELSHSSLRFGVGRFNTEEEIDHAAQRVVEVASRLKQAYRGD